MDEDLLQPILGKLGCDYAANPGPKGFINRLAAIEEAFRAAVDTGLTPEAAYDLVHLTIDDL